MEILNTIQDKFRRMAISISAGVGHPLHFMLWIVLTILWLISGFYLNFNTTWNFVANTSTTVFTFLICLLIQNTQSRENRAMHLKLDELIRAMKKARNSFIRLESQSDKELLKAAQVVHMTPKNRRRTRRGGVRVRKYP